LQSLRSMVSIHSRGVYVTIIDPMLIKLIFALFVQHAWAARSRMNFAADPCLFGCGATHAADVEYKGEKLYFDFTWVYGQTYASCFNKCEAVEEISGNSKSSIDNKFLERIPDNRFLEKVKKNACHKVLQGSKKVSATKTQAGKHVKLCCTSVPCESNKCQFPANQNMLEMKEPNGNRMAFEFGRGVPYKLPSGFCVKDCYTLLLPARSLYEHKCDSHSRRGHKAIATAQSANGDIFGKLCCVPMPALNEEQAEQEEVALMSPPLVRGKEEIQRKMTIYLRLLRQATTYPSM